MSSVCDDYSVFGLQVRSELPLPELFPVIIKGEPEISIRVAPITAPSDEGHGLHSFDNALILVVPDVGRFRICDGSEIVVDPFPGAPDRNVRLFLLGSAFGALLHQRGLLPLHANAVEIDGRAIAFMGPSGAGKSTLAAWFHDQGYKVIADDVCVVRMGEDERAYALPGLPRLRLWEDALDATRRDVDEFERSFAGADDWNKFDVPIAESAASNAQVELGALFVLNEGADLRIERIDGVQAADAVFANTYRGSYLVPAKGEQNHWLATVRLVRSTPVYALERARGFERMGEDCRRILEHLGANRQPADKEIEL